MRILLVLACLLLAPRSADAHCDALDGPVVMAAREALRTRDFTVIAIWVKPAHEAALQSAFRHALKVRVLGVEARELADTYFFETAVRLHREGEGEPFNGLVPAGLDHGPAVTTAERALVIDNADALVELVVTRVRAGLRERFRAASVRKTFRRGDVEAGRAYVASYTDFIHYALGVYTAATARGLRSDEPERHEH